MEKDRGDGLTKERRSRNFRSDKGSRRPTLMVSDGAVLQEPKYSRMESRCCHEQCERRERM